MSKKSVAFQEVSADMCLYAHEATMTTLNRRSSSRTKVTWLQHAAKEGHPLCLVLRFRFLGSLGCRCGKALLSSLEAFMPIPELGAPPTS